MILWRAGMPLIRDVTVSCTTADLYLEASSREAGAAAELAASKKVDSHLISCVGVPGPNQQGYSSVFERVGGDDRGCSSIFVFFVSTDLRCGATI